MTLSHESLLNYYEVNFILIHNNKDSAEMLDQQFPWEREVWVHQLMEQLKKEKAEQDSN